MKLSEVPLSKAFRVVNDPKGTLYIKIPAEQGSIILNVQNTRVRVSIPDDAEIEFNDAKSDERRARERIRHSST